MRQATRAASVGGALLGSALLLATSDAAGERTAVSPAQTVKSKDGGLIVSVPRGALSKPARIAVRTLSRGQFPPELRKVTFKPGSKLYALDPAGLRFLKPVTITRRINAKVQGFDLKKAVPGIVLTTRSAGGKWEILRGQTVRVDGGTLVLTATTRHFSTIVAFDGGARLSLQPSAVNAVVGVPFDVALKATIDNRLRRDKLKVRNVFWSAVPVVKMNEPRVARGGTFTCTKPGTGNYVAIVRLEEESLTAAVGSLFQATSFSEDFRLRGLATCKASPRTTAELAFACVVVAHSPLGSSPSFTRWLLAFVRASLPPNARVELTAGDVNGGQPISGLIDPATSRVALQGGISSFGPKPVQKLTVDGQDVTQQLVAKVGAAPTVTSTPGVIAGQCPP